LIFGAAGLGEGEVQSVGDSGVTGGGHGGRAVEAVASDELIVAHPLLCCGVRVRRFTSRHMARAQ
jgi:hypothetical protein